MTTSDSNRRYSQNSWDSESPRRAAARHSSSESSVRDDSTRVSSLRENSRGNYSQGVTSGTASQVQNFRNLRQKDSQGVTSGTASQGADLRYGKQRDYTSSREGASVRTRGTGSVARGGAHGENPSVQRSDVRSERVASTRSRYSDQPESRYSYNTRSASPADMQQSHVNGASAPESYAARGNARGGVQNAARRQNASPAEPTNDTRYTQNGARGNARGDAQNRQRTGRHGATSEARHAGHSRGDAQSHRRETDVPSSNEKNISDAKAPLAKKPASLIALGVVVILLLVFIVVRAVSCATTSNTTSSNDTASTATTTTTTQQQTTTTQDGVESPWTSTGRFTTGDAELDVTIKDFCDSKSLENGSALDNAFEAYKGVVWADYVERDNNQILEGTDWDVKMAKQFFEEDYSGNCYNFSAAVSFCLRYFGFDDAQAVAAFVKQQSGSYGDHGLVFVTVDGESKMCDGARGVNGWMLDGDLYTWYPDDRFDIYG